MRLEVVSRKSAIMNIDGFLAGVLACAAIVALVIFLVINLD